MKKLVYVWNRLYYGLFLYHSWTQLLWHRILWVIPIGFLCRVGLLNREKHNSRNKEVARSLTDEKLSVVLLISNATMLAFTALIVWTIANLTSVLIPGASPAFLSRGAFMLVTAVLIVPINYFALWRGDKYLEYFSEFHRSSSSTNRTWSIVSICAVLLALLLFIYSMHLMGS